jgi:iron complex transport system substrate-binding protein
MRFSARIIALSFGLVFSLASVAAQPGPQHWVSAGGALSEWVSAMGAQPRLVGVDTTSQHPESLKQLPSIGYQRQLSAEGILSLRPDILVGTEEMGPPPVLAEIRRAGVTVEAFSSQPTVAAVQANLQHLGQLLGDPARAAQLFDGYQQRLQAQQVWVSRARASQPAPGVLLLLGHTGAKPMVGGRGTAADWLLQQAGARNLATNEGYKNFSNEVLVALNPDVIVFADRSLSGEAARQALLKENPALVATRAFREGRLIQLDPTLLVGGLGPRVPDALQSLARALYPHADE